MHPEHIRLRSILQPDPDSLIDFGPDLGAACARDGLDLSGLKQVFLTHTHQDHFCFANAGLLHMSRTRKEPLNIYLSREALDALEGIFLPGGSPDPGMGKAAHHVLEHIRFRTVTPGVPFPAEGYTVTPVATTHYVSERETGLNYLLRRQDGKKLLYACDTGFYPQESLAVLEGERIDLLIMDATYGSAENINTKTHLNARAFRDMLEIFLDRRIIRPDTRVFASHINHKHSFTHEAYQAWFDANAPVPVTVARDGLEVSW